MAKPSSSKRRRTSSGSRAIAVAAPKDERESINVRKIANGYLIERSGTRRGKYFSHTEYSQGRPVISATAAKASAGRSEAPKAAPRARRVPHGEVGYFRQG